MFTSQEITKVSETKKKREKFHAVPAVIISSACGFFLYLYAPFEMYFTNKTDFWFDFYNIIGINLGLALLTAAVIFGLLFLAHIIHPIVYKVLFSAGVVCFFDFYVEGSFLAKNLPRLDGREIDWSVYTTHRILSIVLVLLLIGIVTALVIIFKFEKAEKFMQYGLLVISGILLITVISLGVMNNGFEKKSRLVINKDCEFEFSNEQNIIILVLDAVDGDTFDEVLSEHPEYYDDYKDFTYYSNMVSTYTQTDTSIPYLLTGVFWEGEKAEPFEDYLNREIENSAFLEKLQNENYRIGFYEPFVYPAKGDRITTFDNVYRTGMMSIEFVSYFKNMTKLVGFKNAPFELKKYCEIYYKNFLADERDIVRDNIFRDDNDDFLKDINSATFTTSGDKFFKIYHVEGAHVPFVFDEKLNRVSDSNYKKSVEGSMYLAKEFIDRLKENGVYDNSVVIILADHGFSEEDIPEDRLHPIFFVKGIGETKESMEINDAPASFEDFIEAVERLKTGTNSDGIFDWHEGDIRDRKCYVNFYKEEGNAYYAECIQKGHAGDYTQVIVVK